MPRQVRLSPAEAAQKHITRTTAAVPDMRAGIERVTEAPTAAAVRKLDKMAVNWNAAMQSGKIKRGLQRVDLASWKQAALDKGVVRVQGGVEGAREKLTTFYGELFSYENTLLGQIDGMNDLTSADTDQRMLAWKHGMEKFERG